MASLEQTPEPKDDLRVRLERVLEDNLRDAYFALPKDVRKRFRAEGEAMAADLRAMIGGKAVRPNVVHARVERWLKTIPKVNPWFLVQESKIKTDGVMALMREQAAE